MRNPTLSVCMITYNQAKYISGALDSVLMQDTDFDFEVVIGDDCSYDGTAEIISEYARKYPHIIRHYVHQRNLGPPDLPAKNNFIFTFNACQGDYIAILEGDDYWTDRKKLQLQVDFLKQNPEYTLTCHNVNILYEGDEQYIIESTSYDIEKTIGLREILSKGSQAATCTLLMQNKIFDDFPDWFYQARNSDVPLQILYTSKGPMKYFSRTMATYRRHNDGISVLPIHSQANIQRFRCHICTYEQINKHFSFRYQQEINHYLYTYLYPNLLNAYIRNIEKMLEETIQCSRTLMSNTQVLSSIISFFRFCKWSLIYAIFGFFHASINALRRLRNFVKNNLINI